MMIRVRTKRIDSPTRPFDWTWGEKNRARGKAAVASVPVPEKIAQVLAVVFELSWPESESRPGAFVGGIDRIAKEAGCVRNTARQRIELARAHGYLTILHREGRPSEFAINWQRIFSDPLHPSNPDLEGCNDELDPSNECEAEWTHPVITGEVTFESLKASGSAAHRLIALVLEPLQRTLDAIRQFLAEEEIGGVQQELEGCNENLDPSKPELDPSSHGIPDAPPPPPRTHTRHDMISNEMNHACKNFGGGHEEMPSPYGNKLNIEDWELRSPAGIAKVFERYAREIPRQVSSEDRQSFSRLVQHVLSRPHIRNPAGWIRSVVENGTWKSLVAPKSSPTPQPATIPDQKGLEQRAAEAALEQEFGCVLDSLASAELAQLAEEAFGGDEILMRDLKKRGAKGGFARKRLLKALQNRKELAVSCSPTGPQGFT